MKVHDFLLSGPKIEHLDLHFNESTFGLNELAHELDAAGRPLSCLEIGSGVGLLLARLKERYPEHAWQGMEPIAPGFDRSGASLELVSKTFDLTVHPTRFEDFATSESFDRIFSVNVLEHMDSWRDCLVKAHSLLRPGGVGVFLCPNYSFPYEPHYRLPIIGSKALTFRLFRERIAQHDRENQTANLWTSLNFIKKREVIAFCRANGISVRFDERVVGRMIEKLTADPEFAKRQRVIAAPAKLAERLGVMRLVERYPLNRLSPYAKILISRGA